MMDVTETEWEEGGIDVEEADDEYQYDADEEQENMSAIEQARHRDKDQRFPFLLTELPRREDRTRLSIYQFLHDVVLNSSENIELEWSMTDDRSFYSPILTPLGNGSYEVIHSFHIQFYRDNMDDKPFRLLPLTSMDPIPLFSLVFHPFLTPEHWNPFRSWAPVFSEIAVQLQKYEAKEPVTGGVWEWPLPSSAALPVAPVVPSAPVGTVSKPMGTPPTDLAFEILLLEWYSHYHHLISFSQWCEGHLFDHVLEASDIARIAKAATKYKPYQGVGYLGATAGQKQQQVHPMVPLWQAMESRLADHQHSDRLATWLARSPFFVLLKASVQEHGGNYLPMTATEWTTLFKLVVRFESLCALWPALLPMPESNLLTMYQDLIAFHSDDWVVSAVDREAEDWLPESLRFLSNSPLFLRARQDAVTAITTAVTAGSSSASADATDTGSGLVYEADRRVYLDVEGMRQCHYFIKKAPSTSSTGGLSSKARSQLLRELRFLNKDLMPQITLFVSSESLEYMMCVITITDTDNPYFGGVYVFHLHIPTDYPAKPPRMQFMTTGGGTFRFNPNLYACGKVCLSLLGTWSGPSWDPASSSLNQLLTSVYGLIFTEEPFFNEPGFETRREAYKAQSDGYTEGVQRHVLPVAVLFHLRHPCPVLRDWIAGLLRHGYWAQVKEYFRTKPSLYPPTDMEQVDALLSAPR